jgi:hypothetical protein
MHAPIPKPKAEDTSSARRRKFEKWLGAEQRYRNFLHRIDGGSDAGARVAAKIGTNKSYQWLLETACPGPVDYPHPARINFKKNPNSRFSIEVLVDEIGDRIQVVRGGPRWRYKFEKEYWSRWHHARQCIGDLRWLGKATCSPDTTAEHNAWRGLQTIVARRIDCRCREPILRHPSITGLHFPPFAVKAYGQTRLASFYHSFPVVEHGWLPWHRLPEARRYVYSNIIWTKRGSHRVAERVGLSELVSKQAMAGSRARDKVKPTPPRIARLDKHQEALCFELMASLSSTLASQPQTFVADLLTFVRNKIIEGHVPFVRWVAVEELGIPRPGWDTINEGVFGLFEAIEGFDRA